jgi:purine-nucleoside phosphorylase
MTIRRSRPKPKRPLAAAHRGNGHAVATARNFARHLIEFDSDDTSTYGPHSLPVAEAMRAPARSPIPWPSGKSPTPAASSTPDPQRPLPQFDYLVVTWTVEEAKCLADTLTPGFPSKTAWHPYAHRFASDYVPLIRKGAPALESRRLGSWFPTTIAGRRVLCFKSELHMSQDGAKLPIKNLWRQLIDETRPRLVITTGTAGGIGSAIELGDVVVAPAVRFDCTREFKSAPFHKSVYHCSKLKTSSFAEAAALFGANASHLPPASRPPRIFTHTAAGVRNADVVTTDFFAYDDSKNTFHLQSLGATVEMGDAVLGLVVQEMGSAAPAWIAVRNASDPQIDATGLTENEVRAKAGQIYERFGYWTTIPSAITCWALIVDN